MTKAPQSFGLLASSKEASLMTEEAKDNKPPSGMEEILAELEKQKAAMEELRKGFDSTIENLKKENDELKATNVGLQRALIKNATGDPAPPEKTQEQLEEEKRAAFIEATVKKTLQNLGQHFEGEKK